MTYFQHVYHVYGELLHQIWSTSPEIFVSRWQRQSKVKDRFLFLFSLDLITDQIHAI